MQTELLSALGQLDILCPPFHSMFKPLPKCYYHHNFEASKLYYFYGFHGLLLLHICLYLDS